MAEIVAFNMNPALDLTTNSERVAPTSKIRCEVVDFEAGGGGINVTRVARTLGTEAITIFPAGGYTGQVLCTLLEQSGLPHRCVSIAGRTRQSLTVNERSSGEQFRFVFPGPYLSEAEQQACLDTLSECMEGARIVVVTGSLPPGVRADFFQSIADIVHGRGLRLLLDTSGDALRNMSRGVHVLNRASASCRIASVENSVPQRTRSKQQRNSCAKALSRSSSFHLVRAVLSW